MSASESQRTTQTAGLIGLAALGGALVGFVLQLLVAFYFGAAAETDAYFMAVSVSELLGKLLLGGSITAVFIPLFVEQLGAGKRTEAWRAALNVLHILALVLLVALAVLAAGASAFVSFIAPGFDAATHQLTVTLLRVLLPSFAFLLIVDLLVAMLHALGRFTVPSLLRIIAPTVSIIVLLLGAPRWGIYALAVGAVAGAFIQVLFVGAALHRSGFRYQFVLRPADATLRRLLRLVYPFIYAALVTQSAGIVYRILVSDLSAGSLSSLKFAEKITQLITIMFLNSVTVVIYPLLSQKASQRDFTGMRATMSSAVRLTTFVTVPIIIGVALLREPLIRVLFERGSFDATAVALTATALFWLVIGLATNALSSVLGHAVLALQHTTAAVAVTIVSHAVAIVLFVLLVPRMAHAGLALASSLVPLSSSLLYFLYLRRYIPRLGHIFWHRTYGQVSILAVLLFGVVLASRSLLTDLTGGAAVWQVIVPSLLGSAVFFGGAYLWGVHEMHEASAIIAGRWRALARIFR